MAQNKDYRICTFCSKNVPWHTQNNISKSVQNIFKFVERLVGKRSQFMNSDVTDSLAACDNCLSVVHSCNELYHQIQCLQLQFNWKLEQLKTTMKRADVIPAKVEKFKQRDNCHKMKLTHEGTLTQYRNSFHSNLCKHLSNTYPRVLLSRCQERDSDFKITLWTALESDDETETKVFREYFLGWFVSFVGVTMLSILEYDKFSYAIMGSDWLNVYPKTENHGLEIKIKSNQTDLPHKTYPHSALEQYWYLTEKYPSVHKADSFNDTETIDDYMPSVNTNKSRMVATEKKTNVLHIATGTVCNDPFFECNDNYSDANSHNYLYDYTHNIKQQLTDDITSNNDNSKALIQPNDNVYRFEVYSPSPSDSLTLSSPSHCKKRYQNDNSQNVFDNLTNMRNLQSSTFDDEQNDSNHKEFEIRSTKRLKVTHSPPNDTEIDEQATQTATIIKLTSLSGNATEAPLNITLIRPCCQPYIEDKSLYSFHLTHKHTNGLTEMTREGIQSLQITSSQVQLKENPLKICQLGGCDSHMFSSEDLKCHQKLHGRFKCQFCSYFSTFAIQLAHHELMEHSSDKIKCSRCNEGFENGYNGLFIRHFVNVHLKLVVKTPKCSICKQTFLTEFQVPLLHYVNEHDLSRQDVPNSVGSVYNCSESNCDAYFLTCVQLASHTKNHSGVNIKESKSTKVSKPETTKMCKDIIISRRGATIEQLMFGKVGKYCCQKKDCYRKFFTKEDLRIHCKMHGKFKCKFCPKVEHFAEDLATHEYNNHVKSKVLKSTIKCSRCSKIFSRLGLLIAHFMKVHLLLKPDVIKCSVCYTTFFERHRVKSYTDAVWMIYEHYATSHKVFGMGDDSPQNIK